MKRINYLIQKFSSIAPKAAPLAIVVVGLFVSSPMVYADCSFSPSAVTIHASPGESVTSGFTISGISEDWISSGSVTAWFSATPSGNFTNPYVAYDSPPDTIYPQSPPQKFRLPSSSIGYFSVNIPPYPTATATQKIVCRRLSKIGLKPAMRR
ncbi:exported hypothetical protein [Candidatus Sulfopaludibacter sp. SbA4]|nr:exported hypothetical protein [Candidatus Sulfopaludibacter sp. SbA4]